MKGVHTKNIQKKRKQNKFNPPKITIKIGQELMCITSGNTGKSLKNNILSTCESEKLEDYENKTPEAIHMFGCNSVTQFDTIADIVKTRKRGNGGLSSQDIFKSFSGVEKSNVIHKRRRKTSGSIKNPVSENSCEIPNSGNLTRQLSDMPVNNVDPVDTCVSNCVMMNSNLNSKMDNIPVSDKIIPPIELPENALVGSNLENMIDYIYHVTFKNAENVKATSDDLFRTLLNRDWKIVEDAVENIVDTNLAVSFVKPSNHVISSEKPKCSSTNELPEEVLSLILEATPESGAIADKVVDMESDVSKDISKDMQAPDLLQPTKIEYAEMFFEGTKISVGAYVDAIESSTYNLGDLSVLPQAHIPAIKQELIETEGPNEIINKKESAELPKTESAMFSSSTDSIAPSVSLKYLPQNAFSKISSLSNNENSSCVPNIESSKTTLTDLSLILPPVETLLIKQELIQKSEFGEYSEIPSVPLIEKLSSTPETSSKTHAMESSSKMPLESQIIKPELIKTKYSNDMATKKGSTKLLNIKDVALSKCFTKAMVSTNLIHLSEKTSSLQLNKTFLPCNAEIVKPSSLKIIYLKKASATKPGTDNFVTKKKSANIQNIIKETTKRKMEDFQVENTVPSGYCTDPGVSSTNGKQLDTNAMNFGESSRIPFALLNNKKSSPDVIKLSSKNALQTNLSAMNHRVGMQVRKNLPKIQNTSETVVKTKTLGKTLCYITANSAISLNTKLPIVKRIPCDKKCTITLGKLSASISESICIQHSSSSSSQSQHNNDSQPSTPFFRSLPSSEKKSTRKTALVNSSSISSVKHDSVTNMLHGEIACQSDPKDLHRMSKIDNLFTKSNQLNASQFASRSQSSRSPTDLGHHKSECTSSQTCNKGRKHRSRSPKSRDLHDAKQQMCADDVHKKCEDLEKKKIEAMHDRRIVYVGNLPSGYTETQLKDRFKVFGGIESIEIKSKDCDSLDANDLNSEGYFGNAQSMRTGNDFDARHPLREKKKKFFGFITFKTQADATKAIERGNNCAGPILRLNYGGRRHFVREDYTDLDGKVAQTEEFLYNSQTQYRKPQEKEDDYALMLKQEQRKRGLVSSKTSNSRHSHH